MRVKLVPRHDDCAVLVVAAGRGTRAGGAVPKQYQPIAGRPVLSRTLERFSAALPEARIVVAIHEDDRAQYEAALAATHFVGSAPLCVNGGATRQDSVRRGLQAIHENFDNIKIVLIHDSVRIFLSDILIYRSIAGSRSHGAAIPVAPVADSLRRVLPDGASEPVERTGLRVVQTPQAFRFDLISQAHAKAFAAGRTDFPDDATLLEWAGFNIHTFAGEGSNFKLTQAEDFMRAEALLLAGTADMRVGHGYDVHAFGPGDHVWLGGVKIAHDRGLVGHSDADVGLHALTDALLGALADGDIGKLFPPSDPQWRGAPSHIFLAEAVARLRARGGVISHLDLTLVCEEPRIGPHRDAMRAEIARICSVSVDRVAVKATTSEKLGFTGRGEGVAAHALATIRLPLRTQA